MPSVHPASLLSRLPPAISRSPAVLAALALCLMTATAHAQWKWRDKDGRVTASDRPPPMDVADKDILSRPAVIQRRGAAAPAASASAASTTVAGAASSADAAKTPLEREVEARKRATEQEQAAKAKAEEARAASLRAENCQRARAQQTALDNGQRIARVNAQGEREVLDDKARAEEMAKVRETIATDCR